MAPLASASASAEDVIAGLRVLTWESLKALEDQPVSAPVKMIINDVFKVKEISEDHALDIMTELVFWRFGCTEKLPIVDMDSRQQLWQDESLLRLKNIFGQSLPLRGLGFSSSLKLSPEHLRIALPLPSF